MTWPWPPQYILKDGQPVAEPDLLKWGLWMENGDRRVALDRIGKVSVSTVFLGLDHGGPGNHPPVLWETMIFGGKHDGYQDRYASLDSAKAGHAKALALVKKPSRVLRIVKGALLK